MKTVTDNDQAYYENTPSTKFFDNLLKYCFHFYTGKVDISNFAQAEGVNSTADDLKILTTLKKAYAELSVSCVPAESCVNVKQSPPPADIWCNYIVPKHEPFVMLLQEGKDEEALKLLHSMFYNDLTKGFVLYANELDESIQHTPHLRENFKLYYMDTLVNFAEYLGVIPMENVEQNIFGASLALCPDTLLNKIENFLELKIEFPKFQPELFSIKTKRGHFIDRHIIYMYIALKIKEYLKDTPSPKICEIGAGCGLLVYYLNWLGIKDVTIIDIPSVSFTSAYFLMKNLENRKFIFTKGEFFDNPDAIKFAMPDFFEKTPDKHFDLIVNCDSFPEINTAHVENYLKEIKRTSHYFYSINQEAQAPMWGLENQYQNSVPKLIRKSTGFTRKSRNLFWIRRGYVEELYTA